MLIACYVYTAVSNDSAMIIWISKNYNTSYSYVHMSIVLCGISKIFYAFRMHNLTNFKCTYEKFSNC